MNTGMLKANLIQRIECTKLLTVILVWAAVINTYVSDYRNICHITGQKGCFELLPFLQSNFYFTKIVLFGVICFFTRLPYMERDQLYLVMRAGKVRWDRNNHIYHVLCGIIFAVLLNIMSIISMADCVNFTNDWGKVFQSIAAGNEKYACFIEIDPRILSEYTPLKLLFCTFTIDCLCITLLAELMYTVSLFKGKVWAYITGLIMIVLPMIDSNIAPSLSYVSPMSWLEPYKWRIGYDMSRPDLVHIYVMLIVIISVCILLCQWKIDKLDWNQKEE